MNSRIQDKIKEIKKLSDRSKADHLPPYQAGDSSRDGLSMAIRTPKDAEIFMAELKAIGKKGN